jgi:8-oxo-dGTP pyrophosphatase MutT (NUDIX family)
MNLEVDAGARRRYPVEAVPSAYDLDSIRLKLAGRSLAPETPASPPTVNGAAVDAALREGGLNRVIPPVPDAPRRAAVAAILRPHGPEAEILLIRRAERAGDPWSGHMALPGGHQDPGDVDLKATALRETLEEVGVDLREHDYLGQLAEVPATIRGRKIGISIAPHVFALRTSVSLQPNYEVAEAVWADLGPMARGELDDVKEWHYEGELRRAPSFRVDGRVVWGLTHHILGNLFEVLDWRAR